MFAWSQTPYALIALFNESLPQDPRVRLRKRLGFPCALVNNDVFTGCFQAEIMVRLPPEQQAQLIAAGGAGFAPDGLRLEEYVSLPAEKLDDSEFITEWMARAFAYTARISGV